MCLVCLVSLPFLYIHISDFLSNIKRGACYGTTYGYSFISSLFIIMKCDKAIPKVQAVL